MKAFLTAALALMCFVASSVHAEDCDLTIRDGTAARDLGRILRCMDDRIKNLEARSGSAGSAQSSGAGSSRGAAEFDAGNFAAYVHTASKQGTKINIAIGIRSKISEEIFVAVNNDEDTILMDEASGASAKLTSYSTTGIRWVNSFSLTEDRFTPVSPNATLKFNVSINAGNELKNSALSLSLSLMSMHKGQAKRITVPLAVMLRAS